MPDRRGEGEEPGGDAGVDPSQGAHAVVFEGQLTCEGVDDDLDPLALAGEFAEARGLAFAIGQQQVGVGIVDGKRSEVPSGVALVTEDHLSARARW